MRVGCLERHFRRSLPHPLIDAVTLSFKVSSAGVAHVSGVAGAVKLFFAVPLQRTTTEMVALDVGVAYVAAARDRSLWQRPTKHARDFVFFFDGPLSGRWRGGFSTAVGAARRFG